MIHVQCLGACEIRMGSPYNICRLKITGIPLPDLPHTDWQDRFAVRQDQQAVALVRWDVPGNVPGFRIWVLGTSGRAARISDRFPGCCNLLEWRSPTTIYWEAFPELSGLYELDEIP